MLQRVEMYPMSSKMWSRLRVATAVLIVAMLPAACRESTSTGVYPPPGAPAAVSVSPVSATIHVGSQLRILVAPNEALRDRAIMWSTSDTSKVAIAQDGIVTAKNAGIVTVIATLSGPEGYAAASVVEVIP
jgi:hypothetical protein